MTNYTSVAEWAENFVNVSIPNIHVTDIVEIVIISYFFYLILKWIKDTRAWVLLKGLLIIVLFFMVAAIFQMSTILWLGEKLLSALILGLIVVFQPELRHALETIGRTNLLRNFFTGRFSKNIEKRFSDKTINELIKACFDMASVKTGALIVVEQDIVLSEYERTGISVDGLVTSQLLINIFEKNTPLHDGAVIIRGDRVVSATCYLPLSDNLSISKDLGTRHRAAVGISEVSDSLTIIVSEETGAVSAAQDSKLLHDINESQLRELLTHAQTPIVPVTSEKRRFGRRKVKFNEEEGGLVDEESKES